MLHSDTGLLPPLTTVVYDGAALSSNILPASCQKAIEQNTIGISIGMATRFPKSELFTDDLAFVNSLPYGFW